MTDGFRVADAPPVVGVSCYRDEAQWRAWNRRADILNVEYADALARCGAVALLIPVTGVAGADAIIDRLDALIIAGGEDIDPARYCEQPHSKTGEPHFERDENELRLLDAAAAIDLPTLGICRGMQLMAVHAGGKLEQHVPDRVGSDIHSIRPEAFNANHAMMKPGTRFAQIFGDAAVGMCHHHQSVTSAPGFVIAAHHSDGTVEAIERSDRRFWLGTQWHPEVDASDDRMLTALVRAARSYRDRHGHASVA